MKITNAFLLAAAFVSGGLALSVPAQAQITKKGNAYVFRAKFRKGEVLSYVINTKVSGAQIPGGGTTVVMPMMMKVLNVKPNGNASVDMVVGPATMNGKAMGNQPAKHTKAEIDPTGKVIGGNGSQMGLGGQMPNHPVRIGESWTSSLPVGQMAMNAKATYKLLGFKQSSRGEVANVALRVSTSGGMSMSGGGNVLMLVSDGSLVSSTMNMGMSMTNPQSHQAMNMKMAMKISRR